MSAQPPSPILAKIAYYQNQRGEVPNQLLARELAENRDTAGIREIADHLWDKNKNVQSDCLKVLYEIGYLTPELIAEYVSDFLRLLKSKNNRLVWGAMIGLGTIADLRADEIWSQVALVKEKTGSGTVITSVWGIRTLAKVAASNSVRKADIFPFLLDQLKSCIPRDVPLHAESILCAVDDSVRADFLNVLTARQPALTPAQQVRLKRVIKAVH